MLGGLLFGLMFPRAYLVLITSGGFALIFTYAVIMASHIRYRKRNGCPPGGICQMPGFPYTSWIALISLIIVLLSMPLIPGQTAGLVTGISMVVFFSLTYFAMSRRGGLQGSDERVRGTLQSNFATEFSEELYGDKDKK